MEINRGVDYAPRFLMRIQYNRLVFYQLFAYEVFLLHNDEVLL